VGLGIIIVLVPVFLVSILISVVLSILFLNFLVIFIRPLTKRDILGPSGSTSFPS
jgi:hypothetical protein